MAKQDDFYIGWQDTMPESYAKSVKRYVWICLLLVVLVAIALVSTQRGFADSTFELGQLSTLEGTLSYDPVPSLLIPDPDAPGAFKRVLLLGFGKFSAEPTLKEIEAGFGESLEGKSISLEGTRIYHRGRMLLELTKGTAAYLGESNLATAKTPDRIDLGQQALLGEIYDPKCAFGVMKPGYGKPHRSCAVRCISGGIPPVLHTVNEKNTHQYYLLKGLDGAAINAEVLEYVADQVRICGRVEQEGEWSVLYLDPKEDILRLQSHQISGEIPMCDNS